MEKISVIIPVYNAESTVKIALDSVKNQTYGAFEIIVINDGSTDGSESMILNYIKENPTLNILYIKQENGGVSSARNAGLRAASAPYIALLDADDEWLPQKTARQMEVFMKNPLVDLLGTARNGNKILWPYFVKEDRLAAVTFRKLLIRNELQPSTVIFRRKIPVNTGYFDDNQRYAEDMNYWLRASEKSSLYILENSLIVAGGGKRSFGVSGLSSNLWAMHRGFVKNLNEMFQTKRINFFEYKMLLLLYKLKLFFLLLRKKLSA